MMTKYEQLLARKRAEYGDKFDASDLAPAFVPYFNSGQRIEVEPNHSTSGRPRRGTVGVTTGWKPVFLLMKRRTSLGSTDTLSARDRVVGVVSTARR